MSRIPRRQFLQQTALGAATILGSRSTSAADSPAAPAASRGPDVRFGVRCPFRSNNLRDRALLLKRLGYDGIELGPEFLDRSVDAVQSDLQGTGIVVSAIVGSIQLLEPDPVVRAKAVELDRKRLEMARVLGAVGVIEVPTFGPCRFPEAAGCRGWLTVESKASDDPEAALERAIGYVRRQWGEA